METQKVSDLSTITAVGISDYIPILTDEADNVVEKISIENFVNAGYFEEKIEDAVSESVEPIPNTIYNVIYPIGSIYTGTMQECPIPVGTWELRATSIVTDIEDIVPVKGNGMAIGLTNGAFNGGVCTQTGGYLTANVGAYGKPASTSGVATASLSGTYGLTTDSTKSGIEANIEKTSFAVNMWERVV